ncbi:MAG: class I adenylate-forming enzyme family protein [Paracoccaceae bacterium]
MNPAEWLHRTAALYPDNPALFQGVKLVADYRTFADRAAAIAGALHARGVGPDDRVAVLMKNCTEYLEALYGIWWAGAAAVPINAKLHGKEAAWILENADARLVFATHDTAEGLDGLVPDCVEDVVIADSPAFRALYDATPLDRPVDVGRDDMVWLFYTSGTTGRPKGVMITAGNVLAMVAGYHADLGVPDAKDASLYAAPMSHGAGFYSFLFVLAAARHVVPGSGGFDGLEVLELGAQARRVSMFAAPTMVKRMADIARTRGLTGDGIELIVYAGGPMYLADILEASDVLGDRFAQIYGQGECPMAITVLPRVMVADRSHPRWQVRLQGVGYQQSVSRVRVVDAVGVDLPLGEIGEIVVKGPAVMAGYWQNAEATAETIRDGWLWTGDMGALDADGLLMLHDRSKDMIISGGSNVYPREVEELLLRHDDVAEVAVVGRPHTDWGEEVVACVVPVAGRAVDAAALDAFCRDNIARFKAPKAYVEMAALPKNNYGKVVKTVLRDEVRTT